MLIKSSTLFELWKIPLVLITLHQDSKWRWCHLCLSCHRSFSVMLLSEPGTVLLSLSPQLEFISIAFLRIEPDYVNMDLTSLEQINFLCFHTWCWTSESFSSHILLEFSPSQCHILSYVIRHRGQSVYVICSFISQGFSVL